MGYPTSPRLRQARCAIIGFGCNQAFLFTMLYLDGSVAGPERGFLADRADLLCLLAVMAATFALMLHRRCRAALLRAGDGLANLFAAPLVLALLALVVLQSLLPEAPWIGFALLEGLLVGVPLALLLCLWGRALGAAPIDRSVPEVFIGSALGAAVCFLVVALPVAEAPLLLYALPLGSAWGLRALAAMADADAADGEAAAGGEGAGAPASAPSASDAPDDEATKLSGRILGGTVMFGLATGAIEAMTARAQAASHTSLSVTFILFVLYCVAALQLYGGRPLSLGTRAVLPTGSNRETGPLGGAYRLAVLLMVGGFIAVPLLERVAVAGVAVVLAGYLGVFSVLVSLFLIMGRIAGRDATASIARGFAALFAGEILGVLAGAGALAAFGGAGAAPVLVTLAGVAALYAYLFLFTDRDMAALSVVVAKSDRFDEACSRIAAEAKLSKREAEILPLALRGRTAERIAGEFFISKNTVDTHLRRIYAKCGVHTRQELIDLSERTEGEL